MLIQAMLLMLGYHANPSTALPTSSSATLLLWMVGCCLSVPFPEPALVSYDVLPWMEIRMFSMKQFQWRSFWFWYNVFLPVQTGQASWPSLLSWKAWRIWMPIWIPWCELNEFDGESTLDVNLWRNWELWPKSSATGLKPGNHSWLDLWLDF